QVQLSDESMRRMNAHSDTLHLTELIALVFAEDRAGVEDAFARARETGHLDARFRVGHPPNIAWVEARGTMIEDHHGPEHARLFGTVIDVTERHEAEAKAQRLERQLRAAIDSYTGPFALWDARRRLVLWNQTYANVFGLGPELMRPRASYAAI